ncbi:hypothetical protein OG589_23465 [Sphaerisporangium sp. NBC_01403]|uniref:hypothetical protein n=1 Tax=Sphaerisporangium sp. NBC_01403 TaxID=2903599 RepID=UPI0032564AC7
MFGTNSLAIKVRNRSMAVLFATTVAGTFSFATAAHAASSSALRDPGCTFSTSTTAVSQSDLTGMLLGVRVKLLENGCGSTIRAYVHCNGFPYGTYYRYGASISSKGATTTALCSAGDPRYGKSGYEIKSGSTWTKVPTFTA